MIDCGIAKLTLAGEMESGDLHLVKPLRTGVLVAVVDGLGHGAEAALAARTAVAVLDRHAGESVLTLLQQCHEGLAGTRGVVMSLAVFDRADRSMTWLGVGNVEGVLVYGDRKKARRARTTLIPRGGIVGSDLPRLRAEVISLTVGDTLIFATDGIKSGFTDGLPADAPPQRLADHILAGYGKGTDDALVLVARYTGAGAHG